MKPAKLDLPTIWRGCVYPPVQIAWIDADGNPVNLTGWTPRAYSRYFEFDVRIKNAVNGLTAVSLPIQQTRLLKLGVTNWDFIWSQNDSPQVVSVPFLYGNVEVKESVTDPGTHVAGTIPGGSNYMKMFPGNLQQNKFISLVGRYHQTYPYPGLPPIVPPPDPIPVRTAAQQEMAQMVAGGQTKILIFIWFFHAYLTVPSIPNRIAEEYVQGVYLIPFNPSGVEGDPNVQLTPQQETNLANILADIKAAGFIEIQIKFHPDSFANDINWKDDGGNHVWLQDRYAHNKNFIFSIIDFIEANRGDTPVIYDLGNEHANTRLAPDGTDVNNVHRQYCRFLWAAYCNSYNLHHSVAFSILGSVNLLLNEGRVAAGFIYFMQLLRSHNLPFPGYYSAHHYGSDTGSDPQFTDVYKSLVDTYDFTKKNYHPEQFKATIIGETYYNDDHVAQQIEDALRDRPISIHSVLQFPVIRGHSDKDNYIFPDNYPSNFDAYKTL